MLYSSFGVLCQRTEVWLIYAYVWGLIFMLRMSLKEYSLSKKVEWPEYKAKTWSLLPKLYNNGVLAFCVYLVSFTQCYIMYAEGGIENWFKIVVYPKL